MNNNLFDLTIGDSVFNTNTTSGYAYFDGNTLKWVGTDPAPTVKLALPTKVNFHPEQKATVVYFGKDKVVTRASDDDTYDPKFGFLLAYFQYHSGLSKKKANDYIHSLSDK